MSDSQAQFSSDALPFSQPKQDAILGYLLANDRFFTQCRGKVEPEWFQDIYAAKIYRAKLDFFNKYKRSPSVPEIKQWSEFVLESTPIRQRIEAKINLALHLTTDFGLDALLPELSDWLHCRIYANHMVRGATLFNAKKTKEAFECAKTMVDKIQDTTFEDDSEISFENYEQYLEAQQLELQNALTFGLAAFDKLLTPAAKSGSLLLGDTTILLAPTNIGKSTALITTLRHNIYRQKASLWISHEGRPEDLRIKLLCAMLGCSQPQLFGYENEYGQKVLGLYQTKEGREAMDLVLEWLKRYLVYIPLNKAGLTVEEVDVVIRKRQDEWASKHNGEGFSLLVDDYPAKLSTKNDKMNRREKDEHIYNWFVQLGLEYKFHSLLAIQTNREGSKVNRHEKGEKRLIQMEDVMEAWGPMTAATNIVSINRDPLMEAMDLVVFSILKSRSSKKHWAICCKSNFANSITHSDELGATWYRGTSTMTDKLQGFLDKYNNVAIPEYEYAA
jgi:hypothetical protein